MPVKVLEAREGANSLSVLLVGRDAVLMDCRAAVLRSIGIEAARCTGGTLKEQLKGRTFELAILCHSIHPADRMTIARELASACPRVKLIQMRKLAFDDSFCDPPMEVVVSGSPAALIECVTRLSRTIAKRSA